MRRKKNTQQNSDDEHITTAFCVDHEPDGPMKKKSPIDDDDDDVDFSMPSTPSKSVVIVDPVKRSPAAAATAAPTTPGTIKLKHAKQTKSDDELK